MKCLLSVSAGIVSMAAALMLGGCSHPVYYAAPPPPPPPVYQPGPSLLEVAGHNGFQSGAEDGARDGYNGRRHSPRRTPAYRDTPGYDPNLGPIGPYANAFRLAYLRGYDKGFYGR